MYVVSLFNFQIIKCVRFFVNYIVLNLSQSYFVQHFQSTIQFQREKNCTNCSSPTTFHCVPYQKTFFFVQFDFTCQLYGDFKLRLASESPVISYDGFFLGGLRNSVSLGQMFKGLKLYMAGENLILLGHELKRRIAAVVREQRYVFFSLLQMSRKIGITIFVQEDQLALFTH